MAPTWPKMASKVFKIAPTIIKNPGGRCWSAILGSFLMRMLCWQLFWQHATTRSQATCGILDYFLGASWALLGTSWVHRGATWVPSWNYLSFIWLHIAPVTSISPPGFHMTAPRWQQNGSSNQDVYRFWLVFWGSFGKAQDRSWIDFGWVFDRFGIGSCATNWTIAPVTGQNSINGPKNFHRWPRGEHIYWPKSLFLCVVWNCYTAINQDLLLNKGPSAINTCFWHLTGQFTLKQFEIARLILYRTFVISWSL